jgi:hypothetical protein
VNGHPRAVDSCGSDPDSSRDGVQLSAEVAKEILSAVSGLSFGSVEVTVHESRVVQIERRERVRIDTPQARGQNQLLGRRHPKPSAGGKPPAR